MTVVAGLYSRAPGTCPVPRGCGPGPVRASPRLADGVELLGEYQGSGYSQPPSLVRRADGQVIQMSPLLYQVACRIDGSRGPAAIADAGQRRPGPVPDRRPGPLPHHRQAAASGHRRRRGRPGCRAEGQPAARAAGAGHAAARAGRERRRDAAAAAVPVARRRGRGRQRRGRGLVAVRRPRAGRRGPAGPAQPGGPARRARPVPGLRRVPRVRARGRLPVRRRAARRDRGRHLPGLAVVLHQRHRLLPAVPRRAAAHRPRRPVLQRGLHAGPGRPLRGHLGSGPAPGHRLHAPGDAGAAAPVRPLRRLLHPVTTWSACRTCSPASPPSCEAPCPGAAGTRASPACGAAPGSW